MIELYGCDELNVQWENWVISKIHRSPLLEIRHKKTDNRFTFELSSTYTFFQVFHDIPTIVCLSRYETELIIHTNGLWQYGCRCGTYFYHDEQNLYFMDGFKIYSWKDNKLLEIPMIVLKQLNNGSQCVFTDGDVIIKSDNSNEERILCPDVESIVYDNNLLHVICHMEMGGLVFDLNQPECLLDYLTPHIVQQGNACYFQSWFVPLSPDGNYSSYTTPKQMSDWTKLFVHDLEKHKLLCFGHFILDNVRYFPTIIGFI